VLAALRLEARHQVLNLAITNLPVKRHKTVGGAKIAVILGDFVFENLMIPEAIPGQFTKDAVVLVQVLAEVREDQVGVDQPLEALKAFLDFAPLRGEKAVAKIVDDEFAGRHAFQEEARAVAGFAPADFVSAEDDPDHAELLVAAEKAKKSAATANLNIVAVGAETQNVVASADFFSQNEWKQSTPSGGPSPHAEPRHWA